MTAYDTLIDTDTPVAHYKLGESAGTTLAARVGPAGTYRATGVTYAVGAVLVANNGSDTAVSFLRPSGTSGGYASVAQAAAEAAFDGGGAVFTVEGWLTPLSDTARSSSQNLLSRWYCGLYLSAANIPGIFYGAGGGTGSTAVNPLLAGLRYHLAYTFNGTTHVVYVNGQVVISVAGTRQTGGPFGIGAYPGGADSANATMDEVAVYTTALSAARVQAHYLSGTTVAAVTPAALSHTRAPGLISVAAQLAPTGLGHTRALGAPVASTPGALVVTGLSRTGLFPSTTLYPATTLFPDAGSGVRTQGSPVFTTAGSVLLAGQAHTRALGAVKVNPQLRPAGLVHARTLGAPAVAPQLTLTGLTHARALGSPTRRSGVRQLGDLIVTVAWVPRLTGVIHVRAIGAIGVAGRQILGPPAQAHLRVQGVPTLSGRTAPASLVHARAQGSPEVNVFVLTPPALARA